MQCGLTGIVCVWFLTFAWNRKEAAVAENHEEVKAVMGTNDHDENGQQNTNDAKEASHEDNVPLNEQSSVPLAQDAVSGGNEPTEAQEYVKTEAEKRFEEMQLRREKERLRKQAATSYRQNLEVCLTPVAFPVPSNEDQRTLCEKLAHLFLTRKPEQEQEQFI